MEERHDARRRRERMITGNLAFVNFCIGVNFSILGPFFPLEAKKKGQSETAIGIIFAEFEFVVFLVSPIFGYFLPKLGAKFTYSSGSFVCAVCSILFGFLAYCPPGPAFTWTAIATRALMAVGCGALTTSSFAIIALTYPGNVAAMFGLLETFLGLGFMLGPPLGGALYKIGGFVTPFIVMGTLLLITVPLIICLMDLGPDSEIPRSGSLLRLCSSPHVWINGVMMWSSAAMIGFMDPTLQPFLYANFRLNQFLVGLVFLCGPATYAVFAPLAGCICDKKDVAKELICIGAIITGISYLFLGPSPLLHLGPPQLVYPILFSFPLGIGGALVIVPATNDMMREALLLGMPDDFSTFSVTSGFMNSLISLGYFSGPLIGGCLTESMSFEWAITYSSFGLLGLAGFMVLYTLIFKYALKGRLRRPPGAELSDVATDERSALLN